MFLVRLRGRVGHAILFWFILLTLNALTAAHASPYDRFTTRPGDRISNLLEVRHDKGQTLYARSAFRVEPFDLDPILTIYEPRANGTELSLSGSMYLEHGVAYPSPPGDDLADPLAQPLLLGRTDRILPGTTIVAALEAPELNFDSARIETVDLVVTEAITGDREILRLFETGPDSGVFAAFIATSRDPSSQQDGLLSVQPRSVITFAYADLWRDLTLSHDVLVGPVDSFGRVFDARTGRLVDGVDITIIDLDTNAPAQVFGDDLTSTFPATIRTGGRVTDSSGAVYDFGPGEYRFPSLGLGRYQLALTPPEGYTAPSRVSDADLQNLPGAPWALVTGARLEPFEIKLGSPLAMDIPLDGAGLLMLQREGSSDHLTPGDFIEFKVRFGVDGDQPALADLKETLPRGLSLEPATIRLDGKHPEPGLLSLGDMGMSLTNIDLVPGMDHLLTYVARILPDARDVEVSTSRLSADRFLAVKDMHSLDIDAPFDLDRTVLTGQIYPTGCAMTFDPETDLSGIRVQLENGQFASTDKTGRFSIDPVSPGSHVAAIDPLSLPQGLKPIACRRDLRAAGRGDRIMFDARGGMVEQLRFALAPEEFLDIPDPVVPAYSDAGQFDQDWLDDAPEKPQLIFPTPDHLPRARSTEILVLHMDGQSIDLSLNGKPVSSMNRRPSLSSADKRLAIWKGVELAPGRNDLHVEIRDPDGTLVQSDRRVLIYNDRIDAVAVVEDASILDSDGRTRPLLVLAPRSSDGLPPHPGTIVSLEIDAPFAFSEKVKTPSGTTFRQTGTLNQTVDSDGLIRVRLAAPDAPGRAKFAIHGAKGLIRHSVFIRAQDMPFTLVGLVHGSASDRAVRSHMEALSETSLGDLGQVDISGRVAFQARGVIKGRYLLEARLDSAIRREDQEFFAIDPDRDYILYGDVSAQGDASASRDPLFLRLSGDGFELLYGDFDTAMASDTLRYSRHLTGVRMIFGNDAASIQIFGALTEQTHILDRIAPDGSSGPYLLSQSPLLRHSETLILETTRRDAPRDVVDRKALERGRDYDIDYDTGRIHLAYPLSPRPDALRRQTLIAEYDVENPDARGVVAGAHLQTRLSKTVDLEANLVREGNIAGGDGAGQIAAVDLDWHVDDRLTLSLGAGISHQERSSALPDGARGYSASMRAQWEDSDRGTQAAAWIREETTSFSIANQQSAADRLRSAGAEVSYNLTPSSSDASADVTRKIFGRLDLEDNLATSGTKSGLTLGMRKQTAKTTREIALETRRVKPGKSADESRKQTRALLHFDGESEDGLFHYEIDQEATLASQGGTPDPNLLRFALGYDLSESLTFRGRMELSGNDMQIAGLGFDYALSEQDKISLDLLSAHGPEGDHHSARAGLEHQAELLDGLTFEARLESQRSIAGRLEALGPLRSSPLSNPLLEERYNLARVALRYERDSWAMGGLVEAREGEEESRIKYELRMRGTRTKDFAFGLKARLVTTREARQPPEQEAQMEGSLAYRPVAQRFVLLDQMRLIHREEDHGSDLIWTNQIKGSFDLSDVDRLQLTGGVKLARFDFSSGPQSSALAMAGFEYRHRLGDRIDIGPHGAVIGGLDGTGLRYSAGLSVGFIPGDDIWLSLGYNVSGFADSDLDQEGLHEKGLLLRMRMNFDAESLLRIAGR